MPCIGSWNPEGPACHHNLLVVALLCDNGLEDKLNVRRERPGCCGTSCWFAWPLTWPLEVGVAGTPLPGWCSSGHERASNGCRSSAEANAQQKTPSDSRRWPASFKADTMAITVIASSGTPVSTARMKTCRQLARISFAWASLLRPLRQRDQAMMQAPTQFALSREHVDACRHLGRASGREAKPHQDTTAPVATL